MAVRYSNLSNLKKHQHVNPIFLYWKTLYLAMIDDPLQKNNNNNNNLIILDNIYVYRGTNL